MIRKSLKEEKAITLVALIITIIVLLILAMVSISLVMNGGIIDKSKSAVDKYSEEEIGEQLKLVYSEYQMSQYTDTPLDIQAKLQEIFGNDNVQDASVANGKISAKIKVNGEFKTYEYDASTGKSTEIKPQAIGTLTKDNYGDYIDLGKNIVGTESTADDWRILYNDKNGHVYAILADYLPNTNATVTAAGLNRVSGNSYKVNSTSGDNLRASLNHSTAWQSLIPENLRNNAQVYGAATVDIIMESYNEKYETNLTRSNGTKLVTVPNDNSSPIDTLYSSRLKGSECNCYQYWLASTSDDLGNAGLWCNNEGTLTDINFFSDGNGLCPIVSLQSNIQVIKNGTVWSLTE